MKLDSRPHHFKSSLHEIGLVFIICMAQFLTQGSITMSMSTMNIILDSFAAKSANGIQSSERVWFMGSFALTVGTFILISGKLGDLFGLKRVFIVGWIWCFVWSLITGFSSYVDSLNFFIICRAFQGVGFALLLPCGMGILGSCFVNGPRKNLAFGCVGAAGPTGAAIGCIMAAVIGQLSWWPWEFWVLAICCLGFAICSFKLVPDIPVHNNELTAWEKAKSFDFLGSSLGVSGLVLFNFVWNQGPIVGWKTSYIIVLLVVSILLIVSFFMVELFVAKDPLLPRSIFNRHIGLVLLCVSLGWGSYGIWQYYYWNIVLNLREYTAIIASLTYIPFLILGIIAAFACSIIISKTKPSYIITMASLAFLCGCIMLSVMPVHQSYFRISFGQMLLLAWGMDLSFPAASLILSDYLPAHNQGMAGSLVSTVINYSVSLFLGIASCVETEVMHKVDDELKSYRGGLYFGIGVAGLAVLMSVIFIFVQHREEIMAESDYQSEFEPASDEKNSI